MSALQDTLIATAKSQVGTKEKYAHGHWNNDVKYAAQVPGMAWANFQPWCATFVSWVALKGGAAELYPRTASCDAGGAWFKKFGRWSEYPAIGAQIYFGTARDLNHTGIVVGYDAQYVSSVQGNTNRTGSREGNEVMLKVQRRDDPRIIGYGYPKFPGGVKSADPAYRTGVKVSTPSKPQPPMVPTTLALRVDGADISHHQVGVTLAKLLAFKAAGGRFLYHKATQGEGFTDDQYVARRRLAKAAGLRFGGYHYANPNVTGSDGTLEAKFFLGFARPAAGDLPPVLDLEENTGTTRGELTRFVVAFAAEVKRQTGMLPVVYTPFDLDSHAGCALWAARYHPANTAPRIPAPWTKAAIRQFSNGAVGIPSSVAGLGRVDLNTLPDAGTFSMLAIPAKVQPPLVGVPVTGPVKGKRKLKIGTWNIQRDRPAATVLVELKKLTVKTAVDVLMLQECNDYKAVLTVVPGYTPVAFYKITEQAEAMILVRNGLAITGTKAIQVTFDPDGDGPGIAGWYTTKRGGHTPAKHLTVATVEGFAFVSGHTAPSVQNAALRLSHPRQWRSYKEWSARTEAALQTLGTKVCIGCDWNVDVPADKGTQRVFPKAMLAHAGMIRAFPVTGTAGNRVIDHFGIKGGAITAIEVQHLGLGSDHRPVTALLTY